MISILNSYYNGHKMLPLYPQMFSLELLRKNSCGHNIHPVFLIVVSIVAIQASVFYSPVLSIWASLFLGLSWKAEGWKWKNIRFTEMSEEMLSSVVQIMNLASKKWFILWDFTEQLHGGFFYCWTGHAPRKVTSLSIFSTNRIAEE